MDGLMKLLQDVMGNGGSMPTILLGLLVVGFVAYTRFNAPARVLRELAVPEHPRTFTTWLRFNLAATVYLALYALVYAALILSPATLSSLVKSADPTLADLVRTGPPFAAVFVLVAVIPSWAPLAKIDQWLRYHLQRMASIPFAALHQAREIAEVALDIKPEEREAAVAYLHSAHLKAENFDLPSDALERKLLRAAYLLGHVKRWRGESRLSSFYLANENAVDRIDAGLGEALQTAEMYWLARDRADRDAGAPSNTEDLLERLAKQAGHKADAVLDELYSFISRGLLACEYTAGARRDRLAVLGLRIPQKDNFVVDVNELALVFFFVFVLVLATGVLFFYAHGHFHSYAAGTGAGIGAAISAAAAGGATPIPVGTVVSWGILGALMQCASVGIALSMRMYYERATDGPLAAIRPPSDMRPYALYLLSALATWIGTAAIILAFMVAFKSQTSIHFMDEARLALEWGLVGAASGLFIALHGDNRSDAPWLRYVEAVTQALGTAALAWLAFSLVGPEHQRIGELSPTSSEIYALLNAGLIGLVLGFTVPTGERRRRLRRLRESAERAPVPTAVPDPV